MNETNNITQEESSLISEVMEENEITALEQEESEDSYEENQEEDSDITAEIEDLMEEESSEPSVPEEVKIPLNSPTLLVNESTTRFSGAEWFNEIQKSRIILAGIGGIGSWTCLQLARMVPQNITIYDNDDVEQVNMAGQLYSYKDIGKSKVDAMANMVSSYTSMKQINAIKQKFTEDTEAGDIMICGFDNMRARKTFFSSWLRHLNSKKTPEEKAKCLFLDGRLSMTDLQVLCIRGDDEYNIERYRNEFLFYDTQAEATVCSMKQTTYLACMIGSLIVNLFTNFVANTLDPIIPYDLPFFTGYDSQNMIFKTES